MSRLFALSSPGISTTIIVRSIIISSSTVKHLVMTSIQTWCSRSVECIWNKFKMGVRWSLITTRNRQKTWIFKSNKAPLKWQIQRNNCMTINMLAHGSSCERRSFGATVFNDLCLVRNVDTAENQTPFWLVDRKRTLTELMSNTNLRSMR